MVWHHILHDTNREHASKIQSRIYVSVSIRISEVFVLDRVHGKIVFNTSAAYICHWTGSASVQVMACRLFGAKLLTETMLTYQQTDPLEQTSVESE